MHVIFYETNDSLKEKSIDDVVVGMVLSLNILELKDKSKMMIKSNLNTKKMKSLWKDGMDDFIYLCLNLIDI